MTRERCQRGHLLAETRRIRAGRATSTYCVACHRLSNEKYRHNAVKPEPLTRTGGLPQLRLDFAPLETILRVREANFSRTFNGSSLKRWRAEGIPIFTADELACRLGLHPVQVWGQAFFQEVSA